MTATDAATETAQAAAPDLARGSPELFINRELSWLEFNQRVLDEARSTAVPLLERLKFVSIASSNLDEFFMVRVAGLIGQQRDHVTALSPDGLSPGEQLAVIAKRVHVMRKQMSDVMVEEILPELAAKGVRLLSLKSLPKPQKRAATKHFTEQVLPVLTPLAIDPGHPFPHLRNRSLNLVAMLAGKAKSEGDAFGVVQVPTVLPRLVRVNVDHAPSDAKHEYVLLDDLIAGHMDVLFPGFHCEGAWAFRVIRNFDVSIDEEEAEDLLETMKQEVRRRDRGNAVSVLVDGRIHEKAQDLLRSSIHVDPQFVIPVEGPLNLPDLAHLAEGLETEPGLRDEPFTPQALPPFSAGDEDVFAVLGKGDALLHHPYESFDPVVHFVEQAASDPHVLAIKQTLYRTSGDSPIVKALMRAAENNKQVTALVEIKARFDEENNIQWARRMEEAGVHVVYGLVGLKTHAKACLVVRREGTALKRYVHLGTGNYNPSTARLYTDVSYFTASPEIGEDAASLFNLLTSCTAPPNWKKLVIAPLGLHERILALIEREAGYARAGRRARIVAKMNSLTDTDVILALYRASRAGVQIDLLVRGICCLRPGLPGVSENIRVRSIVDRFLEHARIFHFEAGGKSEVYCASADWMQRNFQRRVEVLFPIEDPALKARLVDHVLAGELADDTKARLLTSSGTYVPTTGGTVRSQAVFLDKARAAASQAAERETAERPFVVKPVRRAPTMLSTPPEATPEGERVSNVEGFPAPARDPNVS
jgi:polyphosphate kinase